MQAVPDTTVAFEQTEEKWRRKNIFGPKLSSSALDAAREEE